MNSEVSGRILRCRARQEVWSFPSAGTEGSICGDVPLLMQEGVGMVSCLELALDHATGGALDADQVAEADVVGGDVVAL